MGRHRISDDDIYTDNCAEYVSPPDPNPVVCNGVNLSDLFRAVRYDRDEMRRCEKAHRVRQASRRYYEKEANVMKKGAYYVKKRLREGKTVSETTLRKYAGYL